MATRTKKANKQGREQLWKHIRAYQGIYINPQLRNLNSFDLNKHGDLNRTTFLHYDSEKAIEGIAMIKDMVKEMQKIGMHKDTRFERFFTTFKSI